MFTQVTFIIICFFYRMISWPITIVAGLRTLVRGIRQPVQWSGWYERVSGHWSNAPCGAVWVHAASVGETMAALNLINHLREQRDLSVVITTATVTAQQCLERLAPDLPRRLMPFDTRFWMTSLVKQVQPQCLLIMETEIWPNLILACRQQQVPVAIINARLSPVSVIRYQRIAFFIRPLLEAVPVLTQSTVDRDRYQKVLGARVQDALIGQLKTAMSPCPKVLQAGKILRACCSSPWLWVAGSTHAGEEEIILTAWQRLRAQGYQVSLILAPRHVERSNLVWDQVKSFNVSVWSERTENTPIEDVLLVDRMGVLNIAYAAADIAFVGGSLVPIGGHNVLEALLYRCLTLTGPHTQHCQDTVRELVQGGMIDQVADLSDMQLSAEAVATKIQVLLDNREARLIRLNEAEAWLAKHRGVVLNYEADLRAKGVLVTDE